MGNRIYYFEMPELPSRAEMLDKAAEYCADFIIGKIKRARFEFIERSEYIELCEDSEDDDFTESTLLSVWGRQSLLKMNGYTSFVVKIKNFEYVGELFVELGTMCGDYVDGYSASCSGSMTDNVPNKIQINILIPKKNMENKKWSPILEQEIFLEIVGTIRHEIQHAVQYTRFTPEEKEANQIILIALDVLGKDKMSSLWNYDKIYFSQNIELEAYIKELQLVAKHKNSSFDEVLVEFLRDHILSIGSRHFNAVSMMHFLILSSIPGKIKKKDKKLLAEIMTIYDHIINKFYTFKKKHGRKITYVKKRKKKIT